MKKSTFFKISENHLIRNFRNKLNPFTCVLAFMMIFASFSGHAQVNYSYGWEPSGLGNWVSNGSAGDFSRSTDTPCVGNASIRANAYYDDSSRLRSPNLGTSLGGLLTLEYSYKVVEYDDVTTPAPASSVLLLVQWASAQGGPWTTIQTIDSSNHIASASCTTKTANFLPPAGNVFLRFTGTGVGESDIYYYLDQISLTETPLMAPDITSFTPESYCAASGVITITGTSFIGAALTIGGTPVTMTTNTATQIVATVPAGVSGTISITTPGGTDTSATPFTVTAPPALTFSSASVSICEGSPSDPLTITAGASDYDSFVWSPSIGVSGNADSGFVFDVDETTDYTLTATNTTSGCVTIIPFSVNVNALPNAITIAPTAPAVCANAIQELTVSGSSVSGSAVLGTGTTAPDGNDFPNPFSAYYGGLKTQMLYRASELEAQGLVAGMPINSIAFDFFASVDATNNALKIRIGSTANNNLNAGFIPLNTLTTVYNATFTPTDGVTGLVVFNFTEDYIWDGNNIVVEVVHNQGNTGNGAGTRNRVTTTTYNSVIFGAIDSVTPAGTDSIDALDEQDFEDEGYIDVSKERPNAVFNYSFENPVTWSPATGLYTDAAATIPYAGEDTEVVYVMTDETTVYTATATNAAGCTVTEDVTVTISTPVLGAIEDITACNSYMLPALTVGDYYTEAGGNGTQMFAGDLIITTQTIFVYAESGTNPDCTAENSFVVTINAVDAPEGEETQVINANNGSDATIEDIDVTGTGIIWYSSEEDAMGGTGALAADTVLESGSTYYAVQTVGECTSAEALGVTVTVVLGTNDFDIRSFSYYPNPVNDILTLSYSSDITSVSVFNLLGQQVIAKEVNSTKGTVDMSNLTDGAYIVNVTAGDYVKTIKVIKKH